MRSSVRKGDLLGRPWRPASDRTLHHTLVCHKAVSNLRTFTSHAPVQLAQKAPSDTCGCSGVWRAWELAPGTAADWAVATHQASTVPERQDHAAGVYPCADGWRALAAAARHAGSVPSQPGEPQQDLRRLNVLSRALAFSALRPHAKPSNMNSYLTEDEGISAWPGTAMLE